MSKRDERRERRQAQMRRRQLMLLAALIVVAVAVVGWIIYQNNKPIGPITAISTQAYTQATGKTLGAADAPVTILVFSDFQCPNCKNFADSVEDQVVTEFVDTGRARLEYRHFIVIDAGSSGELHDAAEASECASDQGQFWNFHDLLFANQGAERSGAFTVRRLKAMGAGMGLDAVTFDQCVDSNRHAAEVTADQVLAQQMAVNSTPTVFINGVKMDNPYALTEFERLISLQEQQ